MAQDLKVRAADGAVLAVRDHGGDGPPIVLLHGAGTHLESLGRLASGLAAYRVVATDQRWSGQSADLGDYSWDVLVSDVEAVVARLGLGNPAVGGHSWGGMIAAFYGAVHPEAPALFNLDGHGPGDPSLYDGMAPEEVEAARSGLVPPAPEWFGSEGDDQWKATALDHARGMALAVGVPEGEADVYAARDFVLIEEGRWRRHPSPALFDGLQGDQRMFEVYRRLRSPFLVVLTGSNRGLPEGMVPLMDAYRRGLDRAFAELAAERPDVRVVKLDGADHQGLAGRFAPDAAAVVVEFLTGAGYRPRG